MDSVSSVFNLLAYLAVAIFVLGFLNKVILYFRTPSPLKIPTTPAPKNSVGVVIRLIPEILFFRSLLRGGTAEKILWFGSWLFHVSFLLIILRHLRFFTYPVPGVVMSLQQIGIWAAWVFPLALLILIARRFLIDRMVVISLFQDYIILLLILGIGITGLLLKYFMRTNLVDVKAFILGVLTLSPVAVPDSLLFLIHLSFVMLLLVYFPFSKLMHAWGVLISPTRAQTDTPREVRHVASWAE
ncbi:MAG: respiratory nitrate reductase subunit gamma [Thermodesulfovibrionia bacterium]|nr:respiratory nitrate reductase subunit gamma [Thermodesulfovibrionia bacterium]